MHHMPTMVGGNLYFNMAGLEKVPFEIDSVVAECGLCLSLRGLKRTRKILSLIDHTHAAASPTGGGFDNHGVPDLPGRVEGSLFTFQLTRAARCDRETPVGNNFSCFGFVAQECDVFGRGANEFNANGLADFGEVGVF